MSLISIPLSLYALKASIRDKLILAMILALAITCSLSIFMGSNAVTEQDQFSTVFAASGVRMVTILGLVVFVVFFIRRSFEAKDIEFLLSRPLSRVQFIASYALAFTVLSLTMAGAETLSLYILSGQKIGAGLSYWAVSILIENTVMVMAALFFAMILSSAATASMACFGLYALARMMGQILGALDAGVAKTLPFADLLGGVMQAVSIIIPRLDLMAQTSWLIYGPENAVNFGFTLLQSIVFVFFVFAASCLDLIRREF